MTNPKKDNEEIVENTEPGSDEMVAFTINRWVIYLVAGFFIGLLSGYFVWGQNTTASPGLINTDSSGLVATDSPELDTGTDSLAEDGEDVLIEESQQSNFPEEYTTSVVFGDIGPQMLDAGSIDLERFIQLYQKSSTPLTEEQMTILTEGSDEPLVITAENSYFLLNFFWAFGLTNENDLLLTGPMMDYGGEAGVGNFASTGGWTMGTKTPVELYASTQIVTLTEEQQARVVEVAMAAYRPCCNNPTHFPDCNHGMALLGVLELMASQDASVDEMFEAAKYFSAFWFPGQAHEVGIYFKAVEGQDFAEIDPRAFVSREIFSGSGFQQVHEYLSSQGLLEAAPGGGSGCGV